MNGFGLDWLNDVMLWIGQLVPRWELCEPTEDGVKFKPGGKVKKLKPGYIYWWWPATTRVRLMDIKRQTLEFVQRLTTKDDVTVLIKVVVVFTIDDVIKALVETADFGETTVEVAQKLTLQPIMSREFRQILDDMAESNEMRNELTRKARTLLGEYGINVMDAFISDITETEVFSHDGGGPMWGGHDDGEEE